MSNLLKKAFGVFSSVALAASMLITSSASVHAASAGEVYKTTDGTVWFITENMTKRPFTSAGAFMSYGFLSFSQVQEADASVTALSTGSFIAPQDGRIFCATETKGSDVAGECSLITGGMKAAFTSSTVFTGQGFSFTRAYYGDSSFLTKTSNIDNASAQHRPGVLVNNGGTVQLIVNGGLWGVPSLDVFNSWGWSFADVVPANSADKLLTQTGIIPGRMAGQLVPSATVVTPPGGNDCNVDGDAGDLTLELQSTLASEDVGEGDEDAEILEFTAEADDGSDVGITSVKVELEQTNAADSDNLDDYVDEVTIWMDGEQVGSADADEFTESSDRYSKSISLDDCAVIDAGDTASIIVAVTALNNLDSGDIDSDVWDVEIDSLRFEDGDGVVSTETPAADAIDQPFNFASFATANDVELKVALSNTVDGDDINEAHVIDIDDTDETDDVEILSFTIEADGDSDLNVTEIPATITTSVADESTVIANAQLWHDGDSIASDTIAAGGAVLFEDLDVDIEADTEEEFTITVDIEDTGDADLANADTVQASVTTTNTDAIEAEDESGEEIADGDASGSAVGEASAVYDAGIMVEFVSQQATRTFTADEAAEIDQGTFEITFNVTAFDADMFIDRSMDVTGEDCVAESNAAGQGTEYCFDTTGTDADMTDASALIEAEDSETLDTTTDFYIGEGNTREFTIQVVSAPDADGSAQLRIESINFGTASDGSNANYYNFNLDEFKTTPYLFLNVY